jgi:hypothetical protein
MRSDANRAVLTHHPLKDSIKLALRTFPQKLQFVWTRLANSAGALGQEADEAEDEIVFEVLAGVSNCVMASPDSRPVPGGSLLAVSLPSL